MSSIGRAPGGSLRYENLPTSLVAMLRASVDAFPDREAAVARMSDAEIEALLIERFAKP